MFKNEDYNSNLTDFGIATLNDRYLMPGETCQDLFVRVAKTYSNDEAHAQRLYEYMANLWFMPATPVLSNGGTDRGLPISCMVTEANDTMDDIIKLWVENSWLSVKGAGIGSYWGNIRSMSEKIAQVGGSSGVIPFMKVQDSITLAVSQGGMRRASAAIYLPIWHPEIEEFIEIRRPTGGDVNRRCLNLNNAVVVDDKFMEAVKANGDYDLLSPKDNKVVKTLKARDLWIRLLLARVETGEPYIMFLDTVNEARPEHQKALGLKIKTSQLCVAPETKILTDLGYRTIRDLENSQVNIWNGEKFSKVEVKKTGVSQKLITVVFSDGTRLDCTPYHKFYVKNNRSKYSKVVETQAIDLVPGDKLEKWNLPDEPVYSTDSSMDRNWYAQGFYSGDGNTNLPYSWLYSTKYICEGRLGGTFGVEHNSCERKTWRHGDMLSKSFVPIGYDTKSKTEWLAGLFDSDGTIAHSTNGDCIQLTSKDLGFLNSCKLMLQELGVHSKVCFMREEGWHDLPANDGSDEKSSFYCQELHRLLIATVGVKRLQQLGMSCERLKFRPDDNIQTDKSRYVSVVSVETTGRVDDTYCFTEPLRHRGMFNGVVTGQCSEITLPTGLDHLGEHRTAVCCLSSLNLEKYDEWKYDDKFIEDVMYFLDNVLQNFIDKAPETHSRAAYSAMRERSIGLGVMGLHGYFQGKHIAWGSEEARDANVRIFSHIKNQVDVYNVEIAHVRGPCPDANDAGVMKRFSNVTAIAPTASISIICGGASPGIEPVKANTYTHKTLSGSFPIKNKYLQKLLQGYGMDNDEVWSSIKTHEGSVQQLDFLSQHDKDVFKTALEIDQMSIIEMAADRTPMIDQAQSLNLFVPATVHKKVLHDLHFKAWELGVKTLYYCRSRSVGSAEKVSHKVERQIIEELPEESKYEECTACQ